MIPTCDDARSPRVKGVIHFAAAFLYGVMLTYHAMAGLTHWRNR